MAWIEYEIEDKRYDGKYVWPGKGMLNSDALQAITMADNRMAFTIYMGMLSQQFEFDDSVVAQEVYDAFHKVFQTTSKCSINLPDDLGYVRKM